MFKVTSKNNFVNVITLLICLIPTSLIIGAAVSEFFLSIAALLFLIYTIIYKDWHYYKKKIFIILIFFYIYILFSSLISEFKINSLRSSAFYFRFYLFFLAIWFLLDNNKNFLKYFFFSIFITLIFAFVYSFFDIFDSIGSASKLADYRISGFFGTELIQGSFFLRLFIVFVGIYVFLNNFKYNFIFYSIFFISIFIILVSGERSSIGLLIIFLFLFFIFYSLKISKKIKILFFIFLTIFLSIHNLPGLKQRIFINTKNLIFENEKVNFFSRGHQEHYVSALKMFKKNIITGVGIRNFRLECRKAEYNYIGANACTTHPHNTYIQFLAETGVIGLIFILSFFLYLCKFLIVNFLAILKRQPINRPAVFFAIAIFINLFPFVPTGSFFNNWLSTLYYLPLAFFFYSLDQEIK
jgi:O-antigen ligase